MSVRAGQECEQTGDVRCRKCGEVVHVEEGQIFARCPVCNGEEFSLRDRPMEKV